MSIEQMRAAILSVYPLAGEAFVQRIKKMPDKQIHAMYMRLLNAKKL